MQNNISVIIGGELSQHFRNSVGNIDMHGSETLSVAINTAIELERQNKAQAIVAPIITSMEIAKHVSIPVITAEPSYFDLLETLTYAEKMSGITDDKIALVASQRDIRIDKLQRYIKNKLHVFIYDHPDKIAGITQELKLRRFPIVVGGTITLDLAKEFTPYTYLTRLGVEAILQAVQRANDILEFDRKITEQNERLRIALNSFPNGVLVTGENNYIKEFNAKALEIFSAKTSELRENQITKYLKNIDLVETPPQNVGKEDILMAINDVNFFVSQKPIVVNNENIGIIYLLQEVEQIEKLEHTYRKTRASGFWAKHTFDNIIGDENVITQIIEKAKAFAKGDSTILIDGRTGTGKEIFAQSIHNYSKRAPNAFVAVNCAAIPEHLLESELFGYEEGAFTGAKKGGRIGLFELAHNGTIFLDEINQIPLNLQVRILRVLQEKQVMRVGGERIIPINTRVIASSNENLKKLVVENKFRDDLYYRLNILNLHLPSLKLRKNDVGLLTEHFIKIFSKQYKSKAALSPKSLKLLCQYDWPGNIRELMNFVEGYVAISSQLKMDDYLYTLEFIKNNSIEGTGKDEKADEDKHINIKIASLEEMEAQLIAKILAFYNGNKKLTLQTLKISRTSLWKKLKEN